MVEAVGLAPGVVATWKTCIDGFDIVDSGRKYGVDYEILRVKLEFERARLLMWGTAVGLGSAQGAAPKPEAQLHRGKIRDTAMRLLGGIHRVFDNTTKLQDRYGLRPVASAESSAVVVQPAETQLILCSIFKCAYNVLRSATEERQRETQLFKKTLWAMHDQEKFQQMVTDVKGFNDGLANLFPEMKAVISHQITTEIEGSEDESALALLQEAAKAEHEDISDCVRVRLETLGAARTAKSLMSDSRTEIGEASSALDSIGEIAKSLEDETDPATAAKIAEMARLDGIPVALAKELLAVEAFGEEKSEGCLTLAIFGPNQYVARGDWKYVLDEKEL